MEYKPMSTKDKLKRVGDNLLLTLIMIVAQPAIFVLFTEMYPNATISGTLLVFMIGFTLFQIDEWTTQTRNDKRWKEYNEWLRRN